MHDVPDLRMFGMRLVNGVIALVLGVVGAFAISAVLPQGRGRVPSQLAPLFLMLGLAGGLAVAFYALLDALRRWAPRSRAQRLPVARVITRWRG